MSKVLTLAAYAAAPFAGVAIAMSIWYVVMIEIVAPFAAYLNSIAS